MGRSHAAATVGVLGAFVLLLWSVPGHADTLVVASNQLRAIDTETGRELHKLELREVITDLAFSPDGTTIYAASGGGKGGKKGGVIEIDAATFSIRRRLTESPARALQIAPDGKSLWTLEWEVTETPGASKRTPPQAAPFRLAQLDLTPGAARIAIRSNPLTHKIYDFLVAPEGSRVFALNLDTDSLQIHDRDGKVVDRISVGRVPKNDPRAPMTSIAPLRTTASGEIVVLKSGARGEVVRIDPVTLETRTVEIPHGLKARDCVVTATNTLLIDAVLHLYAIDLTTGKEVGSVELPYTSTRIALSNDGTEVFLTGGSIKPGTRNCVIQVRRFPSLEEARLIETPISPWAMGVLPAAAK